MSTTSHGEGAAPHPTGDPYAGVVDPAAIRRGHEADAYDSKSVLSVPALVIFFFLLAFGVVSLVFYFVSQPIVDPNANPLAVEQNKPPLNERLNRIRIDGPVNQPRLEPLRMREGNERAITSPETPTGNSPELHPEDIVPSKENTPWLYSAGLYENDKAYGHIPIENAMKLAVQPKDSLFPVSKHGSQPPKSTNVPSAANAGRGFGPSVAEPPKLHVEPAPPKTPEGGKK